jgi:hypothetical protein
MLVVETIAKIRRAYFTLGKPIKEICREFRLSRKVVRKVIRSDATEFHYERSRQPLPRIGPWRKRLEALLGENENRGGTRTTDADPDLRGSLSRSAMSDRFIKELEGCSRYEKGTASKEVQISAGRNQEFHLLSSIKILR